MSAFLRLALLSLLTLGSFCTGSKDAFVRSAQYHAGDYGRYVTQTFKSSQVKVPRPNMMLPFSACNDGMKLFTAPRGMIPTGEGALGPMIFTTDGDFVWTTDHDYGQVYNFQVQMYLGEPYLTFWAGDDAVDGHGAGHYYMLDQKYREFKKLGGVNGLDADLHFFTITEQGTAIQSVYEVVKTDLINLDGSTKEVWVWDGVFQEVDIETGNLTFQWRATDHFPITDSYLAMNEASESKPWDFFHINMVEKDAEGNYLISSRHLRTIFYVDGQTGEVLWRLGGKNNSFEDLSGGAATTFVGQHDSHWADGHRAITFFDNRADWQDTIDDHSRGTRVLVDLVEMTARLDRTFDSPHKILSISQGSYQTLPNGHVLVGYGYNGVMTEFSPDGIPLCDAWLLPSTRIGSGDVQSYRNLKFYWTGRPETPPGLVFEEDTFHMSWLGATEIADWALYHALEDGGEFTYLTSFAKHGFETSYTLPPDLGVKQYVSAVALDKDRNQLGWSLVVDMGARASVFEDAPAVEENEEEVDEEDAEDYLDGMEDKWVVMAVGFFALATGVVVILLAFRRRAQQVEYTAIPLDTDGGKTLMPALRPTQDILRAWRNLRRLFEAPRLPAEWMRGWRGRDTEGHDADELLERGRPSGEHT